MKTTLFLDDDVCGGAFAASAQLRQPFQVVINDALRVGLAALAKAGGSPATAEADHPASPAPRESATR